MLGEEGCVARELGRDEERAAVQLEAQNLARMAAVTTSVPAGGEGPALHPSDFGGAMPAPRVAATPNPLAAATHGALN